MAVLSENKAISASKLKLKLSWVEPELGKKFWGQKILGPKNYFISQFDKKIYFHNSLRLGLSTTLTSEDKNGDFETSLKVKNKDYILMYDGLGAKIENISTNEVVYPINHYFAL